LENHTLLVLQPRYCDNCNPWKENTKTNSNFTRAKTNVRTARLPPKQREKVIKSYLVPADHSVKVRYQQFEIRDGGHGIRGERIDRVPYLLKYSLHILGFDGTNLRQVGLSPLSSLHAHEMVSCHVHRLAFELRGLSLATDKFPAWCLSIGMSDTNRQRRSAIRSWRTLASIPVRGTQRKAVHTEHG